MNVFVVHASHRLTDHAAHGDGLIAWGFIKALAARGHQLWVAAPHIDVVSAGIPGVQFFELKPRSSGKLLQIIEYNLRSRILYDNLSRKIRFDVVHQMNPVVRGYSFGMMGSRTPLVLGPYNGDWPVRSTSGSLLRRGRRSVVNKLREIADRVMQRQARALLITTPYALNRLPGLRPNSAKLHIVPNGIDEATFSSGTPCLRSDTLQILMVGNARHKGVFTIIAAFERVAASLPNAFLVIAGGGPQAAEVKALVDASPHQARYKLIGSIERSEMPRIVAEADIVCVPSFGEPFGMIVLEAMASGKPIAGTSAGGIPYLLGTGSELLFHPGDDAALAEILLQLSRSGELRSRIGASNRRRAVADFTWDSVAQKMETAYRSVL